MLISEALVLTKDMLEDTNGYFTGQTTQRPNEKGKRTAILYNTLHRTQNDRTA